MNCACDCCKARVSSEGELCPACAGRCFPVVNGQVTMSTLDHRQRMHAGDMLRPEAKAPPPVPPALAEGLKRFGKAFWAEAEKELIPGLVKLGEREVKRRLGGG